MCVKSDVKCEVKVIELKDGYQVQITGGNVKEAMRPENLKKCIESCCSGEAPLGYSRKINNCHISRGYIWK